MEKDGVTESLGIGHEMWEQNLAAQEHNGLLSQHPASRALVDSFLLFFSLMIVLIASCSPHCLDPFFFLSSLVLTLHSRTTLTDASLLPCGIRTLSHSTPFIFPFISIQSPSPAAPGPPL